MANANATINAILVQQRNTLRTKLNSMDISDDIKDEIESKYLKFSNRVGGASTRATNNIRSQIILRKSQFFNNYFSGLISSTIQSDRRRSSRIARSRGNKQALKYPWFVVDLSGGRVTFRPLHVPGIAAPGGLWWQIGWRRAPGNSNGTHNTSYPFPTAYMKANNSRLTSNYIKYQNVGAFCNQGINSTLCGPQNYKQIAEPGTNVFGVRKNGSGSLSVKQIAQMIKLTPTVAARRRYFLDFKRNGDWGQIFTCYYLNKERELGILKPGSWKIARDLFDDKFDILNDLMNNFNFLYTNCTFWSADRLACFLAWILGVPVVYQKNSATLYYGERRITDNLPTDINNAVLKTLIIDNFNRDKGINYINRENRPTPPPWLVYLAVLDSAHDFGKKAKRTSVGIDPYRFKSIIMDLIKSFNRTDLTFAGNVDNLFRNISSHEDSVGLYMMNKMKVYSVNTIQNTLIDNNSCIVFDYGNIPHVLKPFMALLSAKYTDPATS